MIITSHRRSYSQPKVEEKSKKQEIKIIEPVKEEEIQEYNYFESSDEYPLYEEN